jgi:uracil-DNA glycosylase
MKLNDTLKQQLNGWERYLTPFIESDDFDAIFRELKSRKARKIKTAPLSEDLWRAFTLCPPEKLKAILVGISPYHTFKDNTPVADGIALSCSKTGMLQPSLENLYSAWGDEYTGGLDPDMDKNPSLEYLAEQGVLLYNVALTVQADKPCSDNMLWSKFNKFFWEVINNYWSGIPIILMGTQAHKSEQYITPLRHYVFKISHPASAAYQNTVYSTEGTFKKVDKILYDNNGVEITWYRKKDWKKVDQRKGWKEITGNKKQADQLTESDLPWS